MRTILLVCVFAFQLIVLDQFKVLLDRFESLKDTSTINIEQLSYELKLAHLEIDSLHDAINKPITVEIQKKTRVKRSKEEIDHIEKTIYSTLVKHGVDSSMALTIVAIGKHESANFNSKLFNDTYNIFGMTYPPGRQNLAKGYAIYLDNGNTRRFCKFESPEAAALDFILYLDHWNYSLNIKTPEEMVRTMKSKRYFEANEKVYLRAVKRHLNQIEI